MKLLNRNARGSLGEREMLWERTSQGKAHIFEFAQLYRNTKKYFFTIFSENIARKTGAIRLLKMSSVIKGF